MEFKFEKLPKEVLRYRLDNLVFTQNLLSCFTYDKDVFEQKYLRNIFWSDDSEADRLYEERMSFGREFHLLCERIFQGIPAEDPKFEKELRKIRRIHSKYIERYGEDVEFFPELVIETKDRLQANIDLLVIAKGEIFIWDWKTEIKELAKVESRIQTMVYMYLVKETIGRDIDFENIHMYYYQPRINKNTRIDYSEELHRKYKDKIYSIIEEVKKWE